MFNIDIYPLHLHYMSIYKKLIFAKCKRFVVKSVKYLYNSYKRINDLIGCKLYIYCSGN